MAYVGEHEVDDEDEAMEAEMHDDPEYQEANISFIAAKAHLNKLRIARGYFLVIAVQDPKKTLLDHPPKLNSCQWCEPNRITTRTWFPNFAGPTYLHTM